MNYPALIFDTETTGLWHFDLPADDESQPRLVQLAALLIDEKRTFAHLNVIVRPSGYEIDPGASRIHGITTEDALQFGVPAIRALDLLDELLEKCEVVVGHNLEFDQRVVMREHLALGRELWDAFATLDGARRWRCTMRSMTPVCRFPSTRPGQEFKWPKLTEAYLYAFQKPMIGAHNAMSDATATAKLYRWLVEQETKPTAAPAPVA